MGERTITSDLSEHPKGFHQNGLQIFIEGASGARDALWEDEGHRENIKDYLDTGEIDVFIMICCSIEFMESDFQSDAAIWNFTSYFAVEKEPKQNWFGYAVEGFPWRLRECKRLRS